MMEWLYHDKHRGPIIEFEAISMESLEIPKLIIQNPNSTE